jgi:hypothetical protein
MALLAIVSTASAVVVAILVANSSLQPIWIVGIPIIFSSTTGAAVARLTAPAIIGGHATAEARSDEVEGW